jgi:succinate dehydrogenase (ubiquinone) iron-sulfur subunit
MNKFIEKDKKNRLNVLKYEKERKILKSICKNVNLTKVLRKKAFYDLAKLPKDSSVVRLRNRCMITGRGRFTFTGFNLSRLTLRKLACEGKLPFIQKSSW